jgi:hypothetical protein
MGLKRWWSDERLRLVTAGVFSAIIHTTKYGGIKISRNHTFS